MRWRNLLTAIAAMALFSSCEDGATAVTPHPDPVPVRISFRMVANRAPATRGMAESMIDINDIRYLLFDADARFLQEITPTATTLASSESFAIYEVTANIVDPYFSDPKDHMVTFHIMALANHSDWGLLLPRLSPGDSIDTLFENGLPLSTLPEARRLLQTGDPGGQLFPMAGLQNFTVAGNMLLTTWDGLPYDITRATGKSVNLLRALAKIEIVDRIGISPGNRFKTDLDEGHTRVAGVELNGLYARGRLLPMKTCWVSGPLLETFQPESASPADPTDYRTPPPLGADLSIGTPAGLSGYSLTFAEDREARMERTDSCPVFSAYTYEYARGALPSTGASTPYLTVAVTGAGTDGTAFTSVYPMRLASYSEGKPQSGTELDALVRNHIYRFEITGVTQPLNTSVTVVDLDNINSSIGFN